MKTSSLINAFQKNGFTVTSNLSGYRYEVRGPKNNATWSDQEGEAVTLKVSKNGDISDSMSDYHAGFFPSTIKLAIEWMLESNND